MLVRQEPTIGEINARLLTARAKIGTGRFMLGYGVSETVSCYITYWWKPDQYAWEDCRAIGEGSVEDCLHAAEAFAADLSAQNAAAVPAIAAE
ncbi:hypothetical protein TSA6c_00295 [Azospirillum sp. TSA6c]|nr:hypothetical protein TSA6c_00295 [Azospirillum sp. TSA6c]